MHGTMNVKFGTSSYFSYNLFHQFTFVLQIFEHYIKNVNFSIFHETINL